jgi:hypothetical protein
MVTRTFMLRVSLLLVEPVSCAVPTSGLLRQAVPRGHAGADLQVVGQVPHHMEVTPHCDSFTCQLYRRVEVAPAIGQLRQVAEQ